METQFWLERWQNNEIGFHQTDVNAHLQDYWERLRVPSGGLVLVPLCGRTRDMIWLRAQGYRILGVELSSIAVRDFYAENGLQAKVDAHPPFERWEADRVTLLRGDLFDLTAGDLEDVVAVYDRAALGAFPPEMRQRYVKKLVSILPPSVQTLLITMNYPQDAMSGPPFAVSEQEVRALFGSEYRIDQLRTRDVLAENARFQRRGLKQLVEHVFRIRHGNRANREGVAGDALAESDR
ncbi:MAG: thiopurine S-methyltransferase [Gammaproteobacteria bacterium]|nr:thiopurine S-methyltransferase [Gammaproteobacteria bacterium]